MSSLENQRILEQLAAQVRVLQAQVSEASPTPRETTGTEPYSRRYTRSSTVGRPSTTRRHNRSSTSMERQTAFLANTRRPRAIDDDDGEFEPELFFKVLTVISKKFDLISKLKPTATEVIELNAAGLGEITVELSEDDSSTMVRKKIESACPLLKQVDGWFGVVKAVATNSGKMELASVKKTPIPTGRELKAVKSLLYVAPLRKDIVLPPKLSGDFVKCQECFIDVDAFSLMDHILVCKPQTEDLYNSIDESVETVASYQPILYRSTSNPAGNLLNEVAAIENAIPCASTSNPSANLLNEVAAIEHAVGALRTFKLATLDFDSLEENVIEVNRPYYLAAALEAVESESFMEKIKKPLKIRYLGEAGVDGGGLRRDYLTNVVNGFETALARNGVQHVEDAMFFTAGVFTAIAVLQENITRKYAINGLTNSHFVRGLNVMGLGTFLMDNADVKVLFRDDPVSGNCLLSILRSTENADPTANYIERHTFQLFSRFINEVSDGEILRASGQRMEVADIVMFATGSRHVCASMDKTIGVRYVYPEFNNYPRPSASTCIEELTLAVTFDYNVFKAAWVEAVASLESGFPRL